MSHHFAGGLHAAGEVHVPQIEVTFNIAALAANSNVVIFGGGGDDTLQTVNSQFNSDQFDLDDIFVGEAFFFNGAGGDCGPKIARNASTSISTASAIRSRPAQGTGSAGASSAPSAL